MVHHVTLRSLGDGYGITIPKDLLEYAGLLEDRKLVFADGEKPEIFIHYDPETREVSFTLPEAPADSTHPLDERSADSDTGVEELSEGERRALKQDD